MDSLMPSPWSRPWAPRNPRVDRTQRQHLTDMWVLTVPAGICGADSFEASALFGQCNQAGFLTFPELSHGLPAHDT